MSSIGRRAMRLAAHEAEVDEGAAARAFEHARVAIRLAPELAHDADARESFVFATNQILRFCPRLSVSVPDDCADLAVRANGLARAIVGAQASVRHRENDADADITLSVGAFPGCGTPCVAIGSSGWNAQLATFASDHPQLARTPGSPNPLGALAAACLGTGQVFFALAGLSLASESLELSTFDLALARPGELPRGPDLPKRALELEALLVGCGAVMNGFAYAAKRLPLCGRARAVDRQRLRSENVETYVLSSRDLLGEEKVEVLRRALAPAINVETYAEDFDPLFTVRLQRGHFPLAPIVVAGLDGVMTRHTVQRLWPGVLIDMGTADSTAQVMRKRRAEEGLCVVHALRAPESETSDVRRLAAETGLTVEAVLAMDSAISEDDVLSAPAELRDALADARSRGQLRCGFIRTRALDHERSRADFAAAAPFVSAYSGVAAAAQVVRELMGLGASGSMRHQFSFHSMRARTVAPLCDAACECHAARA